ncbi:MAG: dihydrolipoyl dehydrogenase [Candidatus Erginobacter occultus]|nr:dihydrolipoyl dehydrogenase [Candidatus Erginobacter occultus]
MKQSYDLIVIGAGPAGYPAAIRASRLGLKTAIIEKEYWGGVCLNVGCIPTKALLRNAELAGIVSRRAKEFGLGFDNLTLDYGAAFRRSRQVSERLVKGVNLLLKKNGVDSCRGRAYLESPRRVRIETGGGETSILETEKIIVATGARPRALPGLETDGEKIITYTEAILSPALPKRAVIIGGGPIGVEFAAIWRSYGVEVTIVEILDRLLPAEDPEVSAAIERAAKKSGISLHTASRVEQTEKTPSGVRVRLAAPKGERNLETDWLMVAAGFQPNVEGLGLEDLGVSRTEKGGFIAVDEKMETSVAGIFAAGDVTGKLMLAHAATAMGVAAAEAAAGENPEPLDYRMIPRCVYTQPQAASFGFTEEGARAAGFVVAVGKFPFLANGKALGLGEREGFVKIVAEKDSGKILGAALAGPEVTELLGELTLARRAGLTLEDIAANIHSHPTLSEAVGEAADAALNRALHI